MHEQIRRLAERLYDRPIMDNRERGDYAEQLVASQIEPTWKWVGSGWHPWDFETGTGHRRLRMQVRQSAARQLWPPPKRVVHSFATTPKPKPLYAETNNPGLVIEDKGRFCEIYVFAWHSRTGSDCDHREPSQWEFFILPEHALGARTSVKVQDLKSGWLASSGGLHCGWCELGPAVAQVLATLKRTAPGI